MRYEPLTQEQIEKIVSVPGVSSYNVRYMTGGICDEFIRSFNDFTSYDFSDRLVVEGTVTEIRREEHANPQHSLFYIEDVKILAGNTTLEEITWQNDGYTMGIGYSTYAAGWYSLEELNNNPPMNRHNSIWRSSTPHVTTIYTDTYKYSYQYLTENLNIGDRYAFVLRFPRMAKGNPSYDAMPYFITLYDFLTEPWCKAIWDITDAPENYLDLEEYALLRECVEITAQDIHTLDVVYTDDMAAIKQVHDGDLYALEGRLLTPEDTENNSPVCVINSSVAKLMDLSVGDTISLKLGDELFEQFYGLGATAVTPERFADNWTEPIDFEIVGIYDTVQSPYNLSTNPNWTYSHNTVFVPMTFLPLTDKQLQDHEFSPAEFSFVVENQWNIEKFVNEGIPQIEAMELTVTFDDGGWMEVVDSYESAQRLAIIRIVLLVLVTGITTVFIVYLYITRRKKDYAIMRALGTTQKQSSFSLLLPLIVLGTTGIVFGTACGILYTVLTGNTLLIWTIPLCVVTELIFMLIFAAAMLQRLGKFSPLELLQSSAKQKKIRTSTSAISDIPTLPVSDASELVSLPKPIKKSEKHPAHSLRFTARYVKKHIRRATVKSLCSFLLAALMVGAITQFAKMTDTYEDLRRDTVITGRFVESLQLFNFLGMKNQGYAIDLYYERTMQAEFNYSKGGYENTHVVMTNNIGRYINEEYTIEYAPEYDESCIGTLGPTIIIGDSLMELCGYELGESIRLTAPEYMLNLMSQISNDYYKNNPNTPLTIEELYTEYEWYVGPLLEQNSEEYVIAGVITTPSGAFSDYGFTPGQSDANSRFGTSNVLDIAEFQLADNSLAEAMISRGQTLTHNKTGAFVMDTSKLDSVIRTSEILRSLYPAAVAAALIIGAFLCALIIFQTSTEAAIMRVLGTTKKKTAAILTAEQCILALSGIILGILIMAAVNGSISVQSLIFSGAYFAVILLGSAISSVLVTRRNILDLLQTKE